MSKAVPARSRRASLFSATAAATLAFSAATGAVLADTYYVSPNGSDNADGLTPATAWKSVAKVNTTTFAPGSQILFQSGGDWHESLSASSSGTADAPIVYGSYGDGAKPIFWGSDVVANSNFSKLVNTTSTYLYPRGANVNAMLLNHQFLHDASQITKSTDVTVNRAYVDAHPDSWTFANGNIYVNTGGINPKTDNATITAAVRDDVVYSNGKDNLVFQNLAVNESAKSNAGYAFRVQNSNNVQLINDDAANGGKHDFGVINSNNFLGSGLHATSLMPDQGYGGATAFVSYSDLNRSGDTSKWVNCTAEKLGTTDYQAFYTHGEGIGAVTVENLTARDGAGIGIATDAPTTPTIKIIGGSVDNAMVQIMGNGVLVDGMHVTGKDGVIDLRGKNNTVQNVLMSGVKPDHSEYAAIRDGGQNNLLQFNTVVLDPTSPVQAAAIAILNAATGTKLYGNILDVPVLAIRQWFDGPGSWFSDYNMISPNAGIGMNITWTTLAQWQAMGFDVHSLLANPQFVDALNGDYTLADGSPGIDRVAYNQFLNMPMYDFTGDSRPSGAGYDLGAFETVVPEPAVMSLALLGGAGALLRRRPQR